MQIENRQRGFTLVEMMILLSIMTFLIMIRLPDQSESYGHNRKAMVKAFLLKVSAYQADYFKQHQEYAPSLSNLGVLPSSYLKSSYNLQLTRIKQPSGLSGYRIKATPINSANNQALWLNHLGQTSINWND